MRRVAQIIFPIFVLGTSLSLTACGGESSTGGSTTGTACSNGICGSGGASTTTSGMGGMTTGSNTTGAGGMTTTGSNTTATTSSGMTTGSAGCVESWLCTPWDGKGTDNGTRVCTDTHACGTTMSKPVETATLPALDKNFFQCNVQPIMDAKCSMMGCHGTETGRALRNYSRGKLRDASVAAPPANPAGCPVSPLDQCTGTNDCHCVGPHALEEWQKNYDAARGFALDAQGNVIPMAQADTSDLIQQPVVGGKSHAGVHLFKANDAEYTTFKNWLSGSTLASCNASPN